MRADIAPFPACDLEVIDLTDESTPPPSSDSSSDTDESNEKKEERANVAALMSKSGHVSLVKVRTTVGLVLRLFNRKGS